jgi:2-dehydro-3-deoxy-D-arabinonate dehydratase
LRIVRYAASGTVRVGRQDDDGTLTRLAAGSIAELLRLDSAGFRATVLAAGSPEPGAARLLPPVDGSTEIWASGVTYQRSNQARQEESDSADVYARVYDAQRPELFFKCPAWRTCGDGEPLGIRPDSAVNVPEPELALVISAGQEIVGLTVCNDMSSRTIEGENPLYLPQAKLYRGSCGLGPGITPLWEIGDPAALAITLTVVRDGALIFDQQTSTGLLHRTLADLTGYLYLGLDHPDGAILSTGTGIVPDLDFSLAAGDVVAVTIAGVGTLTSPVVAATAPEFSWLTPDPLREAPTREGSR